MKNLHLKLLAFVLTAMGLSLCTYKVMVLGLPLTPDETAEVWRVDARVSFRARGATTAQLYLPLNPPGLSVLDEDFVVGNWGLSLENREPNRQATFATRRASGSQVLYYRITLDAAAQPSEKRTRPSPEYPEDPEFDEPHASAVEALLANVRRESSNTATFTQELLKRLSNPRSDENAALLADDSDSAVAWVDKIREILAGAKIPSRTVWGLPLRDGMMHGVLTPWLEVHNGKEWLAFDPSSGKRGFPENFLVWYVGDEPLMQVDGGRDVAVEFSSALSKIDLVTVAEQRARLKNSRAMEFSLFGLPIQTQNVYRVLLMVPVGALIVVLMRNLVGIKTFGTFMPILIALSFRETGLLWGVLLLILIVAMGLGIRFYLEQLKLLLVPRLASVLIVVVLLMAGTSLISHKLGLDLGLSVALFPMVILAMVIERMSLSWEEVGPREAFKQGGGSLLVAILGYFAMSSEWLGHMIFLFPELLLVLLAFTLLMGRYSGYRLSEFWRFRAMLIGAPK